MVIKNGMIHRELIDLKLRLLVLASEGLVLSCSPVPPIQSRANRKRYHAFGAQGGLYFLAGTPFPVLPHFDREEPVEWLSFTRRPSSASMN